MSFLPSTKYLALVGGVGAGAAAQYYLWLAKAAHERGLPLELVMVNADVERVGEFLKDSDREEMAGYFAGLLRRAARAGAVVGAIPSVACHYCIAPLEKITPVPLVNLLTAVREEVLRRGVKRAALMGTKYSMRSKLFGHVPGVEWVQPTAEEFDAIDEMYMAIVRAGAGTAEQHAALTRIAQRLCREEGAECILLAGTDLMMVFDETNTEFPALDCAQVHLQAILREIL